MANPQLEVSDCQSVRTPCQTDNSDSPRRAEPGGGGGELAAGTPSATSRRTSHFTLHPGGLGESLPADPQPLGAREREWPNPQLEVSDCQSVRTPVRLTTLTARGGG